MGVPMTVWKQNWVRKESARNIAVVNFRNATAHKFRTSLEVDGDGEPVTNTTPVSFSTNEQRDIDLYFRFRDALGAYIANFSNQLYDPSLDSKTHIISPTHPHYSLVLSTINLAMSLRASFWSKVLPTNFCQLATNETMYMTGLLVERKKMF